MAKSFLVDISEDGALNGDKEDNDQAYNLIIEMRKKNYKKQMMMMMMTSAFPVV